MDIRVDTTEIWKCIPGYSLYEASNLGRIRSWNPYWKELPRLMELSTRRRYPNCQLRIGGERRYLSVHLLVALAFHGDKPSPIHQVAHLDGNPQNNAANNLAWKTPKENDLDKDLHGRRPFGESHKRAKLCERTVWNARIAHKAGAALRQLARMHGIDRKTMTDAIHGKHWPFVPMP